jgi:hypothetical protein
VLNSFSQLQTVTEDPVQQIWTCEFCGHSNEVSLEPEEIPTTETIDYILMSASQMVEQEQSMDKDITVVFCIDVSGSMCVTQAMDGVLKLKGAENRNVISGFTDFDMRE